MATRLRAMSRCLDVRGGRCTSRAACLSPRRRARRAARRVSPSRLRTAATVSAARASTTAIMPMPQLKVRSISFSAMPPVCGQPLEHRQHRNAREVDARAQILRQHARDVVGKSAAGDVRQRLDRLGLADRGEAGFDIDAGRRRAPLRRVFSSCRTAPARSTSASIWRRPCAPANSRWSARRTRRGRAARRPRAMSSRGRIAPRSTAPTAKPARS